jgi:hypothetical protein
VSDVSDALRHLLLKIMNKKGRKKMTNKELLERMIKNRDQFMSEYEQYRLSIDERLPYLDMIIKLNQEIRTIEVTYTDLYE